MAIRASDILVIAAVLSLAFAGFTYFRQQPAPPVIVIPGTTEQYVKEYFPTASGI